MLLEWMKQAVQVGASDLHLSAGRRPLMRHLGDIVPLAERLIDPQEALAMARQVQGWLTDPEGAQDASALAQDRDGAFQRLPECSFHRSRTGRRLPLPGWHRCQRFWTRPASERPAANVHWTAQPA